MNAVGPSNRRPESSRQTLTPHISLISSQHQTATLLLPGGLPVRPPHTVVSVVANAFLFLLCMCMRGAYWVRQVCFGQFVLDNELSWDCWAEFSNCCRCLGQVDFYDSPLACCRVFYKHSAHVLRALPYGSVNKIPHCLSSDWTGADSPSHWRLSCEHTHVRPTFCLRQTLHRHKVVVNSDISLIKTINVCCKLRNLIMIIFKWFRKNYLKIKSLYAIVLFFYEFAMFAQQPVY